MVPNFSGFHILKKTKKIFVKLAGLFQIIHFQRYMNDAGFPPWAAYNPRNLREGYINNPFYHNPGQGCQLQSAGPKKLDTKSRSSNSFGMMQLRTHRRS